jgi:hypothetical protein
MSDKGGKIIFFTSTLMTELKEAPIIIPIAISIILPLTAKSLNSFISFTFSLLWVNYYSKLKNPNQKWLEF